MDIHDKMIRNMRGNTNHDISYSASSDSFKPSYGCVPVVDYDISFGESVLSLFTLVDGKTLSYSYSNREVPNHVREFQMLFRSMLSNYIENHGWVEKQFLNLCTDHVNDIVNENFDFLQQTGYKME